MIEINLLPKIYQKKKFGIKLDKNTLYVIGGGIGVLVLLFAYSLIFQIMPANSLSEKIKTARIEAAQYDSEIALIKELKSKKNLILSRISTIEVLDRDRDAWINVISDLGSRVPNYLWLTGFEQASGGTQEGEPAKTTINGRSFSINSLATFLIKLKKSPYLKNIEISTIALEEEMDVESYTFTINCDLMLTGFEDMIDSEKTLIAGKQAAGSEF
ncbi:MAG: PilN domain-containing protein [candidate division Zixibacteria bacterium]|nr:PilN domain-containing protein [candidate division Zixibacteria bacterium]